MEVRELQPDEWAIMRFPTFRNPWRWGLNSRIPAVTLNNYNQSDYSFNESKAITATSNEWLSWKDHKFGDHTYLPVVETRDVNVKPDPGLLDIMISGKREHGWRQSHAPVPNMMARVKICPSAPLNAQARQSQHVA